MQHTRKLAAGLAVSISLLLAAAGYRYFHATGEQPPASLPPPVETVMLQLQPAAGIWQATGTVRGAHAITVAGEITGVVGQRFVRNGQQVQAGEKLLDICHGQAEATLQRDEALLSEKKLHHDRLRRLEGLHAVSQEALAVALSEYRQAEATVRLDRAVLSRYHIVAPFAGRVGIWQIDEGEFVRAGDPLITLTQLSPASVDFVLPARLLSRLHAGDSIRFVTPAFPRAVFQGHLAAIEPQLDAVTRNIRLRAQLDNDAGRLVPGLFGEVTLAGPRVSHLYIPQEAVMYDPKGASVYVLENAHAIQKRVTLSERRNNAVRVTAGLAAGEELVTAGMMKLFPGAAVRRLQHAAV